MFQFSAGSINKAVPSFSNQLREYVKTGGGHFEHLLQLKKKCCRVFEIIFDNVKTARLPWLEAA